MDQLRQEWVGRLTPGEREALGKVSVAAEHREAAGKGPQTMPAREALAYAANHCFERRSSVPVKVLLSEALRHGVGAFDVADAWRGLEQDGRFTAEVDGQLMVTSRDVLAEEQGLIKLAANGRAVNGVLYNGDLSLRLQAQVVFDALNYAGGVS